MPETSLGGALMNSVRNAFYHKEDGVAALEFAIIAPVFVLMLFGMIAFGIWLSAANTIQQVAAGAARASVAGLNNEERETLARSYVANMLVSDAFIDADHVMVAITDETREDGRFLVTVSFDATHLPIWNLIGNDLLPGREIRRESVIVSGGI